MTNRRVTRLGVESLDQDPSPFRRVTRLGVEVLNADPSPMCRVTRLGVEVLQSQAGPVPTVGGLHSWYDASELALANGATVSSWANKGPFGNALSFTPTSYPTFETPSLNGLGGVVFTGTNVIRTNPTFAGISQLTIFFVTRNQTTGTAGDKYINDQGGRPPLFGNIGSSHQWIMGSGTSGGFFLSVTDAALSNSDTLWTFVYQATGAILRVNQTQVATGTIAAGNDPTTGFNLGATGGPGGFKVYEYLVYDAILTGGDIDLIEDYLFNKWLLPASEGSSTGTVTWAGAATGIHTPPAPPTSGNRMGGTGAIRKPPR